MSTLQHQFVVANVTCVSIGGRGVMIEGPPGSGKSSLALDLIDRGAVLIGDDAVALSRRDETVWMSPPPNTNGLLEIRGVGIVNFRTCEAPLCLVLDCALPTVRLPQPALRYHIDLPVPCLGFAESSMSASRAEWALRLHGLPLKDDGAETTGQ